ncbi:putative transmembrane sensor domain protein [Xenococcus sp. PCC 7305]|uniref:CHASE2 domain-containing protein n=1 Tax=Xenococcus sp. PCC 7305 TaxID=102125 RepID=UPI0002ACC485|nr:CHASE2 domain-containing protein [Xenococcus sp. PCC 7305]ELS01566.1 putative transmembrane sensor domain protein [Xenococcus sp. PCC 7305]
MWQKVKRILKWQSNLLIVPCVAGLIIIGSNAGIFRILEWATLDQFFRLRPHETIEDRIVIVTINEADIQYVQQWPISDLLMAELIRRIKVQNPRAIAMDIYRDLAVEPGHQELVEQFKNTPNLIGIQKVAGQAIAPSPILKELGQVAANDLILDTDGKARRGIVLLGKPDGEVIQGLGVKMALLYLEQQGIELEAIDAERKIYGVGKAKFVPLSSNDGEYHQEEMGGYQILLNYRGELDKFTHISLTEILEDRLPENFFKDRLVLVGAIASSLNDNYATPYNSSLHTPTDLMPGIVITANLTSQIISAALDNRPMLRATVKPLNWLWIIFWSGYANIFGALLLRKRWLAVLGIVLGGVIIITVSYGAFVLGWLIPVFTPLFAVVSTTIVSIGLVLWQNLMLSRRKLKDYAHSLEDKVQARTVELANANEEIRSLNAKLTQENLRMGAELDVARQLQQMVLPKPEELAAIEGIELAGYMKTADEVGGDYYDVLYSDGLLTIGIGDVTGHGLESGIVMMMTQTAVRTLQEIKESDPVKFLDALNRTIYKNVLRMNSEKNLTLSILNYSKGRVTISGQHEETLVVRTGGTIEHIDTMDLGLPIGIDDDIADFIDYTSLELTSGDGLVLYTDGITEAFNLDKKQYGMERFCQIISQNWQYTAQEIQQAVIDDVRTFIGKQTIFDDMTLVILKQQ